jgi:hypothetical protein
VIRKVGLGWVGHGVCLQMGIVVESSWYGLEGVVMIARRLWKRGEVGVRVEEKRKKIC